MTSVFKLLNTVSLLFVIVFAPYPILQDDPGHEGFEHKARQNATLSLNLVVYTSFECQDKYLLDRIYMFELIHL